MAGLAATDADRRIGERLLAYRRAARLTQRAAATVLGVSPAQLQKYEKGTNRIAAASLPDLADLFGVPVSAFFDPPRSQAEPREITAREAHEALCSAAEVYAQTMARNGTLQGVTIATFPAGGA